jgi:hypothetical protein
LNREVAIKVLAPTLATNATARQRFIREQHVHVTRSDSYGDHCGKDFWYGCR